MSAHVPFRPQSCNRRRPRNHARSAQVWHSSLVMAASAPTDRSAPTRSSGGDRSRAGMRRSGGGDDGLVSQVPCFAAEASTGSFRGWVVVGVLVGGVVLDTKRRMDWKVVGMMVMCRNHGCSRSRMMLVYG